MGGQRPQKSANTAHPKPCSSELGTWHPLTNTPPLTQAPNGRVTKDLLLEEGNEGRARVCERLKEEAVRILGMEMPGED